MASAGLFGRLVVAEQEHALQVIVPKLQSAVQRAYHRTAQADDWRKLDEALAWVAIAQALGGWTLRKTGSTARQWPGKDRSRWC